jgi:hypothetical protein
MATKRIIKLSTDETGRAGNHKIEQLIDPQSEYWVVKKGYSDLTYQQAIEQVILFRNGAPWVKFRVTCKGREVC